MTTEFIFTDEAGAVAHIEMLEADLTAAQSSVTALTTERDALRAENETLKSGAADFSKRVASEVARLGIRAHAVDTAPLGSGGQKGQGQTATQRVLAAKGVGSLEELEARGRQGVVAVIAALLLWLSTFSATAQFSGVITLLSGGTNKIAATATNAPLFFACDAFDSFGLQASGSGQSGTPSNIVFWIYGSLDSDTYASEPFTNLTLRLSGTTTNTSFAGIQTAGAATIKVVGANTNATAVSNLFLKARFKAPKVKLSGS